MLIDLHGNPAELSPAAFAKAAVAAGLDAVVVTDSNRTDRLDDYLDALEDAGVAAYAGVELTLDRGTLVFIPRDLDDAFFDEVWPQSWTLESALSYVSKFDGILIGGHPYCRDLGNIFGDRIYQVKGLAALEVRVGRGKMQWDNMADTAADRLQLVRVGGSGDGKWVGRAATSIKGDIETQPELVEAIEARLCWPVEFEPLNEPRDRSLPEPSRPSFGPRDEGGEERPRGEHRSYDDRRSPRGGRPYGDRRSFGDREKSEGGDEGRSFSPRRSMGERRSFPGHGRNDHRSRDGGGRPPRRDSGRPPRREH